MATAQRQQSFLMPTLAEQCDPRQPLKQLADRLPWGEFDEAFGEFYSEEGRPAKPVRLMVGLLLLKQLENLSDEMAVERWVQNPYYQYFCGMKEFQWELPCDPTDRVYFRRRIGEEGVALILAASVQLHGEKAQEREVVVDSTVQEKNIGRLSFFAEFFCGDLEAACLNWSVSFLCRNRAISLSR